MRKHFFLLIASLLLLGAGCAASTTSPTATKPRPIPPPSTKPVFCTQEAKLCPDGSYVGRSGPNCEFAPCP